MYRFSKNVQKNQLADAWAVCVCDTASPSVISGRNQRISRLQTYWAAFTISLGSGKRS